MKKFAITLGAIILFAGFSNAQVTPKKPTTPATDKQLTVKKPATTLKKPSTTAATVTPAQPTVTKPAAPATAIKRKHTIKTVKPAQTTTK